MASFSFSKMPLSLFLSLSIFLQGTLTSLGHEIICEDLPKELCAFSIATSGKRCLLEKSYVLKDGEMEYQCRTSEVVVERMAEWIETDECVSACGVNRNTVGIASDLLLEPQFTAKLCSSACYQNCPNIVDLYFNLAAGEGVFLPDLCEAQSINAHHHRSMIELRSSGVAPGPISTQSAEFYYAAAPAPFFI